MPIVNASDGKGSHIFMPFANVYQVSLNPVEAIIAGNITSLEELSRHAPQVVSWLKNNLSLAHADKNINNKIKAVLGAPRFVSNLEYFGLWKDLIEDCKRQALELGQGMKRYYDTHELALRCVGGKRHTQHLRKVPDESWRKSFRGRAMLSGGVCATSRRVHASSRDRDFPAECGPQPGVE